MPSRARQVTTSLLLVIASSRCAVYENAGPGSAGTAGRSGAGGEIAEGGTASTAGTAATSGATSGAAPGGNQHGGSPSAAGSSGGSGDPTDAGAGGVEGGAPSEGGQPPTGGVGGVGGAGGGGGMAGTGGMSGLAGMAGMGGFPEVLLSQGKPATSDSEQTAQSHLASHANDGDTSTRWCAANSALNHYWRVDLGQSRTLTKVHLLWEKDFAYLFKIETSTDNAQWSMAVDKTASSTATASQDHALPPNTKGRYVRLTVTGGLQPTTWASLYEAQIFGY